MCSSWMSLHSANFPGNRPSAPWQAEKVLGVPAHSRRLITVCDTVVLTVCFLSCSNITWELLKIANSWTPPQTYWIRNPRREVQKSVLRSPPTDTNACWSVKNTRECTQKTKVQICIPYDYKERTAFSDIVIMT